VEQYIYIGMSWDKIKDDETGRQFKDRVESLIKDCLANQTIVCETLESAWYDG